MARWVIGAVLAAVVIAWLIFGGGADDPTLGTGDAIPAGRVDEVIEQFNRGVAQMEQFQPADAVETFEGVVALAPRWTTGRLNLGLALLNSQSPAGYERAEVELTRVSEAVPDEPHAHFALGLLFRHLGRVDEARTRLERALELDPDDPYIHFQLGSIVEPDDAAAARRHFERTLEAIPHHEAACYRLSNLLRRAGEEQRADQLYERFTALKAAEAGEVSGFRYGETGRYAEVLRWFDLPEAGSLASVAPAWTESAAQLGLDASGGGAAGWPVDRHGPGVGVADVDGDGRLDVLVADVGGSVALYRGGETFSRVTDTGIEGAAVGGFFGDYDLDGDPDLYLTRDGTNRLYRNDGGRFTDATATTATGGADVSSAGAAWADADHDGDLDLYVCNSGAPNALFRNNGDGTFVDVAGPAGLDAGTAASLGVLFFDADDDSDLDLLVLNDGSANRLFLNDRVGQYREGTGGFEPLLDAGPATGALAGDVDRDGLEDVVLLRGSEPSRLVSQRARGQFVAGPELPGGAVSGAFGDVDLDGDLDLVLLGATQRLHLNIDGLLSTAHAFGAESAPSARGAVAVDLDGDGVLELLVAHAGAPLQVWRQPRLPDRHWLTVAPSDVRSVGAWVEVKAGRRVQAVRSVTAAGYLSSPPPIAHFGLGFATKADYVRTRWPDSVLQSEVEVAVDRVWRMPKVVRRASSCPVLFSWDGEKFAFVTDFLGVGGLGFFGAPGEYAPPDPTEAVRVPPELVALDGGRYRFRVTEPLEEVCYVDQLELRVYDHPRDVEIHPDERFTGTAPFPTGEPLAVRDKLFPVSARDDSGRDVLPALAEIDRHYVEPPKDPRFLGYGRDHYLELDFGDRWPADGVLYLHGWVEYTYSHINYAAYQAGLSLRPPSIEVPAGQGEWEVAIEDAGFPAGLPRMMTVDVGGLSSSRLRIRTNMEVFWDQIFVGSRALAEVRSHRLEPAVAELRSIGVNQEYSPDGRMPTIYDYHRIDHGVAFKNLAGHYTRFGDVRELLSAVDDLYVVIGRGDEIALEFDASGLPGLPAGWARTLVLWSDGFCKDMDPYTAFPDTVEPLPYHAMGGYPPDGDHPRRDELGRWSTRYIGR